MHRIDRVGTKRLLVVLFQDALAGRLKVGFHLVPDGSCLAELEYSAAKLNASKSAPMLAARASRTICATWSLFPWPCKISTIRPSRAPSPRSEEHTSELQSLMRTSSAVFCWTKKKKKQKNHNQ